VYRGRMVLLRGRIAGRGGSRGLALTETTLTSKTVERSVGDKYVSRHDSSSSYTSRGGSSSRRTDA